ncbi:hypothetical protein [Silicimonas sp. MF1-12-2]|uniref:hypothetical protein n=1 Tax=Silicimonas sp. MF1-12-2 TaxID=3384793 RepID=UPI0039B60D9D
MTDKGMTEREAVDCIKNAIIEGRFGPFLKDNHELMVWETEETINRAFDSRTVAELFNDCFPPQDRYEYEIVRRICARLLRKNRELPKQLADWLAEELENPNPPKKEKKSPFSRNASICYMVHRVWVEGYDFTRNPESPPHSACDIVAKAMKELRLRPQTYEGVYAIWKKRSYYTHLE